MRSLYESILDNDDVLRDSVNKEAERARIEKWCKENMSTRNSDRTWDLDKDNRVINNRRYNITIDTLKEKIPEYIKFGDISTGMFFGDSLNLMSPDQLPTAVETAYLTTKHIPKCTLNIRHCLYFNPSSELKIDKGFVFNIIPNDNVYKKPYIYMNRSGVDLESLHNIRITNGIIYKIEMVDTPASKEIIKQLNKLKKKGEDIDSYLDSVFPYYIFPDLRYIEISPRKSLEHNPISKKWILY